MARKSKSKSKAVAAKAVAAIAVQANKAMANKKDDNVQDKDKDQLRGVKDGGVGRPKSKKETALNREARKAFASGDIASEELKRKRNRDEKTLYIRFKVSKEQLPKTPQDVWGLHPAITDIRVTRQESSGGFQYCHAEFRTVEDTKKAKTALAMKEFAGGQIVVDGVGDFSEAATKEGRKKRSLENSAVNPCRLVVQGAPQNTKKDALKQLFEGCLKVTIDKKKPMRAMAFIDFPNPGTAKAAFDKASDLSLEGHKLQVTFAKKNAGKGEDEIEVEAKKRSATEDDKENNVAAKKKRVELQAVEESEEEDEEEGEDEEMEQEDEEEEESEEDDAEIDLEDTADKDEADDESENDYEDDDDSEEEAPQLKKGKKVKDLRELIKAKKANKVNAEEEESDDGEEEGEGEEDSDDVDGEEVEEDDDDEDGGEEESDDE